MFVSLLDARDFKTDDEYFNAGKISHIFFSLKKKILVALIIKFCLQHRLGIFTMIKNGSGHSMNTMKKYRLVLILNLIEPTFHTQQSKSNLIFFKFAFRKSIYK